MPPPERDGRRSLLRRIPPAIWFFALLFAGWALEQVVPLPIPFPTFAWQIVPAFTLVGAAALFAGAAIHHFAAHRTSLLPFSEATALLTSGPFRLSRNPLYVALVAVLLAFALLLASGWLVLAAGSLFAALDRLVIPDEETKLARAFGDEYTAYARRVRRWL